MKLLPALLLLHYIYEIKSIFNMQVKKFELCDPNANYLHKTLFKFRTVGRQQFIDGVLMFEIPLDNNIQFTFTAELLLGQKYVPVFNFTEGKGCDAIHKYMGEFAYDVERAAQLIPGLCPIRKGTYRIRNFAANYNKITLQAFPFGDIRITIKSFLNRRNDLLYCVVYVIENMPF